MSSDWQIDGIEVTEGFLANLSLPLGAGLTCVIGPRGSGKSTLANALRYAIGGLDGASKQRLDLFKANLSRSVVSVRATRSDGGTYAIRRESRGSAILTSSDGRALSSIDLDRGTFLPLDAYSAGEIEDIANEDLGPRRRVLLDQLRPDEHLNLLDQIAGAKRDLDANADLIRAQDRTTMGFVEQTNLLADARDRLAALGKSEVVSPEVEELQAAARQDQLNLQEIGKMSGEIEGLERLSARTQDLLGVSRMLLQSALANPNSSNNDLLTKADVMRRDVLRSVESSLSGMLKTLEMGSTDLASLKSLLLAAHLQQAANYAKLKEANEAIGLAVKERAEAEQAVEKLSALELAVKTSQATREALLQQRKALRGKYISLGDELSSLRTSVATSLHEDTGDRVRISLRRAADRTAYVSKLTEGLRGAGVTRHESIVEAVSRLRPDELAQLMTSKNYGEFEAVTKLESDRAHKVLDAFRQALDPFELEVLRPDDMVSIELNVGGREAPLFKDASLLSQGQKCTALLPMLLARRSVPLIIDQPEDNLDNHFIYETVVKSILRMKRRRQMIFVTHNANIPVLAEAELIVVLGSDGFNGRIEKIGTVDECREEIIDLLEGGEEAFKLRQERYGRR